MTEPEEEQVEQVSPPQVHRVRDAVCHALRIPAGCGCGLREIFAVEPSIGKLAHTDQVGVRSLKRAAVEISNQEDRHPALEPVTVKVAIVLGRTCFGDVLVVEDLGKQLEDELRRVVSRFDRNVVEVGVDHHELARVHSFK